MGPLEPQLVLVAESASWSKKRDFLDFAWPQESLPVRFLFEPSRCEATLLMF